MILGIRLLPDLVALAGLVLIVLLAVVLLRRTMRGRRRQLLGAALIGYGLIGIVIFVFVALSIGRPLERARQLSVSVQEQRAALIVALDQAESTIGQMGQGVGRMDTSLAEVRAATDRAATISTGVSTSMYLLRDAMQLTILGQQPLVVLAAGFDQTGAQLGLLAQDMTTIGAALETNRVDAVTTSANLTTLATSVLLLTEAVRNGPSVDISSATIDSLRLAIYAVAGWLVLLALGCVLGGTYLIVQGRRPGD